LAATLVLQQESIFFTTSSLALPREDKGGYFLWLLKLLVKQPQHRCSLIVLQLSIPLILLQDKPEEATW
jgi:hypothetical protein